jgi:hypothetical protein
VRRFERERIMNQGAVRAHDPREDAFGRALAEGLEGSPVLGRPLVTRLRNFRPAVHGYLAALGGPLPYMRRLRQIEDETNAHVEELARRREELLAECNGDGREFAQRWRALAGTWNFAAVNALIDKHNRYYPAESRLPMDPRTGDFALVNGESYRKAFLGSEWILERFPLSTG